MTGHGTGVVVEGMRGPGGLRTGNPCGPLSLAPRPPVIRAPRIDMARTTYYVGTMFAVGPVLVSDALLDAAFACDLGACRGACCVDGERGAPLEPEERAELEAALAVVGPGLLPEARATIAREGVWEGDARRGYATTTVAGRACVFVVYDRGVATCAVQRAYHAGKLGWEKPVSCHLYPIRVERYGDGPDAVDVLNYETIDLCAPARSHGRRTRAALAHVLARPLTRRYGPEWYARFLAAWRARRADLGIEDRLDSPGGAREAEGAGLDPAFALPVLDAAPGRT